MTEHAVDPGPERTHKELVGEDEPSEDLRHNAAAVAEAEQRMLIVEDEVVHMSGRLRSWGTTIAAQSPSKASLLTSLFLPDSAVNEHKHELFMALLVNLAHPLIDEVHVLLEAQEGGGPCTQFDSLIKGLSSKRGLVDATAFDKIRCTRVPGQPTYGEFFMYATEHMSGQNVMLANTDVVFDETLARINFDEARRKRMGYVLSVLPPPYASTYKKVFGGECDSTPRCTIGDYNGFRFGGSSWDVYIVPSSLLELAGPGWLKPLNHTMNIIHGENHAAYHLEFGMNITLHNPCQHVHALHWHCLGTQMHADANFGSDLLFNIMPCWDCPGVTRPPDTDNFQRLCASGVRTGITLVNETLSFLFMTPGDVRLCCPPEPPGHAASGGNWLEDCQNRMLSEWNVCTTEDWKYDKKDCPVPMCRQASDVECVLYEGENYPHCTGDRCNLRQHLPQSLPVR